MTAFDTDIMTLISAGDPASRARMRAVAPADRYAPVVAAAEVVRGWLNAVRRAEAGKGRLSLGEAYDRFGWALRDLAGFRVLPYAPAADALFVAWRAARIRIGTNDLRIAATCVAHTVKLATRNARDFAQVPGLMLDIWT